MQALILQHTRQFRFLSLFLLAIIVIFYLALPPAGFPTGKQIEIISGSGLAEIGEYLVDERLIKSATLFRLWVRLVGAETSLQAGDYWFEERLPAWVVISRLTHGRFVAEPIRVTIPEGLNVQQLSSLLVEKLAHLDDPERLEEMIGAQLGELMPDTYFWPPEISTERVIELMRTNFARQTRSLRAAAILQGRSWDDVLVMASLVEEEASDPADRRLIAGLLWKRLDDGMRLQVDVAPETYERDGLPAQAIANISLDALDATVYPRSSDFWYYISDENGTTHYAETFEKHKQNIVEYL